MRLQGLENKVTEVHNKLLIAHGDATLHGQHGSLSGSDSENKKKTKKKEVTAPKRRRTSAETKVVRQVALTKKVYNGNHPYVVLEFLCLSFYISLKPILGHICYKHFHYFL